jgi:hypothetical protein
MLLGGSLRRPPGGRVRGQAWFIEEASELGELSSNSATLCWPGTQAWHFEPQYNHEVSLDFGKIAIEPVIENNVETIK